MSNGEEEERYFDHFSRPDPPPPAAGDWEPRLRGDLLLGQILRASLPDAVREMLWIIYVVGRLIVWEAPKLIVEIAIIEPLKRRFWRRKDKR